jgi:hypothetical protein
MNEIEVLCLYCSGEGKEVSYHGICNKDDIMDESDYIASDFWCSFGGFR